MQTSSMTDRSLRHSSPELTPRPLARRLSVIALALAMVGLIACGGDDDDAAASTGVDIGPTTTEDDACTKLVAALKLRADSAECTATPMTFPVFSCPTTAQSIAKAKACAQYQVKSLDACVASIPTATCGTLSDPCDLVVADNGMGCP